MSKETVVSLSNVFLVCSHHLFIDSTPSLKFWTVTKTVCNLLLRLVMFIFTSSKRFTIDEVVRIHVPSRRKTKQSQLMLNNYYGSLYNGL